MLDPGNLTASSAELSIVATSISTGDAGRDKHLRSDAFFDVKKFPVITFKSTSVTVVSKTADSAKLRVTGDFTMKGVTKPVTLDAEFTGLGASFNGRVAGFSATTQLNRQDYGVSWNTAVEGTNILGDLVDIEIGVEAGEQQPAEKK